MKKVIPAAILVLAVLSISACGGTPTVKKGEVAYSFVGCHTVTVNPASDGELAFIGPMIPLNKGDSVYFKLVNPKTLEVGGVSTGEPCK